MLIFDIILLIILSGFTFYGLFFGLIRTVGSLVGIIGGIWLTSRLYLYVFSWFSYLFFGHETLGKIITFLVLFVLINRLICFLFALIDRMFDIISIIPFLKTINRLAGAVLGFIEGALVLGLVLYIILQTSLGSSFSGLLAGSKITPFLLKFIKILAPLLPSLLEKLKLIGW